MAVINYLSRPEVPLPKNVFVHFKHLLTTILAVNDLKEIVRTRHDKAMGANNDKAEKKSKLEVFHIDITLNSQRNLLVIVANGAFKLVKDVLVLVEAAELVAQILVDVVSLHWLLVHIQVPDLNREVVTRHHVAAVLGKLEIRHQRDELREEGRTVLVHLFKDCDKWKISKCVKIKNNPSLTLRILVTKSSSPHVAKLYGSLARRVGKDVAVLWMKLCGRDHLRQLLHVRWLDIDNDCKTEKKLSLEEIFQRSHQ